MRWLTIVCLCMAPPAAALDLALAGASPIKSETTDAGSVRLPSAPYSASTPPTEVEGAVSRTVLRSPGGTRTTLQLLAPLRDQLSAAGYKPVFTCSDRACGGFDFRFQLDLLPAPDMFVDLGDFRYLLMRRDGADPHTASIVTSRSSGAGFVHITLVGDADISDATPSPTPTTIPSQTNGLIEELTGRGHVTLEDLVFSSGSATLEAGTYDSLTTLADWMAETPGARISLVGHTDSVGSRDANQALSQRRAVSARDRLIEIGGLAPERVEAAGVGYLAPIAPNTTEEGRAANRRVEVILLSIE